MANVKTMNPSSSPRRGWFKSIVASVARRFSRRVIHVTPQAASLRCVLCHDDWHQGYRCVCGAVYHNECFIETCATLGCYEERTSRAVNLTAKPSRKKLGRTRRPTQRATGTMRTSAQSSSGVLERTRSALRNPTLGSIARIVVVLVVVGCEKPTQSEHKALVPVGGYLEPAHGYRQPLVKVLTDADRQEEQDKAEDYEHQE